MSQNKKKKKNEPKKELQNKKDTKPSGEITVGEVVSVSDDKKQNVKRC